MKNHEKFYLGIKGLITNSRSEILLLLKDLNKISDMRLNPKSAYWDLPGGRLELGSTIKKTLKREIEEELGQVKFENKGFFAAVLSNLFNPTEQTGLILFVYDCPLLEDQKITINEENTRYGWFKISEAVKLLKFNYSQDFLEKLPSKLENRQEEY